MNTFDLKKTITPLIWRVIVFLILFVVISGLIGPRIINGNILFRDGFGIYGGMGKAAIFGLIAFVLLARHKKFSLALAPWRIGQLWWAAVMAAGFAAAWYGVDGLLAGDRSVLHLAFAHGGVWLSVLGAALACFGLRNVVLLWHAYRREALASVAIAGAFYIFLTLVYSLWPVLASVVLWSVQGLLAVTGLEAVFVPPHTLVFDKFGITVAEFCSGIESIALFSGLYAIVGLLDWHRLNRKRYFVIFPIALLVLFLLNIVRVYALIAAGYYINPEIAFSLFHTYAGMVFFIIYSVIFWAISYRHMITKQEPTRNDTTPAP